MSISKFGGLYYNISFYFLNNNYKIDVSHSFIYEKIMNKYNAERSFVVFNLFFFSSLNRLNNFVHLFQKANAFRTLSFWGRASEVGRTNRLPGLFACLFGDDTSS